MRSTILLLCLLTALTAIGCSGSSPTSPEGGPLLFTGTVEYQGKSIHDLDMIDDGLLSVTLTDLRILLFDTAQGSPSNAALGFGLGQEDEKGECVLTTNLLINRNQVLVYRLSRDLYCMSIFDAGTLPEDALLGYELQAVITN